MAENLKGLPDSTAQSSIPKTIGDQNSSKSAEKDAGDCIEIKVLFFARARDLTGLKETSIEMQPGSTAGDCVSKLLMQFPKLEEISSSMVVALNEEYVPESTVLRCKDELAIIPPISGGVLYSGRGIGLIDYSEV